MQKKMSAETVVGFYTKIHRLIALTMVIIIIKTIR